jgi:hypothetical protein
MKSTNLFSLTAAFLTLQLLMITELASAQIAPGGPQPALVIESSETERYNIGRLADLRKRSEQLKGDRAGDYLKATGDKKNQLERCYSAYSKLYKTEKSMIDIRMAFGYVDTRDGKFPTFVYDQVMRASLLEHLTQTCPGGLQPTYFACGFTRDADDANILIKNIKGLDGHIKKIQLTVTHGSSSFDDDLNCQRKPMSTQRCVPHDGQKYQTRTARENFLKGLQNADVVFYAGHSRDGGGPDFSPPYLDSLKSVDERRYRTEGRKNYQAMLSALRETPRENRPKILGLFSCSSNRWFKDGLKSVSPETGLIGSTQTISLEDELVSLTASLDSIIGMRCEEDFSKSIALPLEGKTQFQIDSFFQPVPPQGSQQPQNLKGRSKPGVR